MGNIRRTSAIEELALTRLSRNIGVLQTTVAEMVTVREHQRESLYPGDDLMGSADSIALMQPKLMP
jgi:hypothetical protein